MKIEIERYITKNYYELIKIAKKYTKNDDWSYELLHEVILQLFDKEEIKVKLDDESIKYYIIRALMVNWCLPSSPFYRKYKKIDDMTVDIGEVLNIATEETELENHQLLEIIENEWIETDWFNKIIFQKYMVLGSLKKVSVDTSIPLTSIARYVKETKNNIKLNTFKKFNNG